jgi:archaellum component FlaC
MIAPMTEETPNLVLEHLRYIRGAVDSLREDVRDLKHRVTAVERGLANFAAAEADHYASLASRMDRLEDRMEHVERRLGLIEA